MLCTCTCASATYSVYAGVAAEKPQAAVAKKRAAVPSRAAGPPSSSSAGAPPPPSVAEPSATELRAAASPAPRAPLTKEQALQQAHAEGLALRKADTQSGYANVYVLKCGPTPWQASVRRGDRSASLGAFATAEEAALCVARSPEGQLAAERAAAAAAAAATRSSSATSSTTAASAQHAADDSALSEEHAWVGSVRTPEPEQHAPLGVGQSVEAHYGVHGDELWWAAVVTKVRYHAHARMHMHMHKHMHM